MTVEIQGLGGLEDELEDVRDRIESADGEVPADELLTAEFMREYTDFDTFGEFLDASKWRIETQADFERIPEAEFDRYVDEHTGFDSWETMLSVAGKEYVMLRVA